MPYPMVQSATETTDIGVHYAVRVGVHGQVGRFSSAEQSYRPGMHVICRTARGLEVGRVLRALSSRDHAHREQLCDGPIVRAMVAEDQLLWGHLQGLAEETHAACQSWLSEQGLPNQLLEVEPLLDGRTLYFHFLNEASLETEQQIDRLVQIFQETVAASSFAKLLEHGCGPGCGTEKAKGCSSCTSCSTKCAVKATKPRA